MSRNVGNYRLLEELGEGAMGTVWRALDTQLDRDVAMKSLRPELARRADIVERFWEEAKLQGRLESPNIVRLYQFLREGDEYFMVMEFVRGSTLSKILAERTRLPTPEAVRIVCQALNGLGYAHKKNVIHRDVKPANIMIGEEGIAKVTDFGIARLLGSARMTKVGSIVGTLEYISPEAVKGKEANNLSDIYSTGVVLYELLSGRLPFTSDNEFELARAHLETPPPPLRQWLPDIPKPLEDAVMRALHKDPGRRFHNAEAMITALNACVQEPRQDASLWNRWFSSDTPGSPAPTQPESRQASELEERRRKAISTVSRRVDELIGAGDWQRAQKEIEDSIRQFPGEPSLSELSARIAREQRFFQESLEIARREARSLLDNGLPQVARDSLQISIERFRGDKELSDLLRRADDELSAQAARYSEIKDIEDQVAGLQKAGRYQEAVTAIIEAVSRMPHNPELAVLLGRTVQAQKEHEKALAIEDCRREVSALRKAGDWEKAFAAIDATLKRFPGDPTLLELHESVQAEHAAILHAREIEDILTRSGALERDNRLDDAETLILGAVERFPDEPPLRQRLIAIGATRQAARVRALVDAAIAKALPLREKKNWDAALAVLDDVPKDARGDKRLTEFRLEVERARDQYRAEVKAAVDKGRKLIQAARLEDAFVALSDAVKLYPDEPSVSEARLEAQRKLAAERRERQLNEAASRADELLAARAFIQAEEYLLDALARFPDDPRLTPRLSSAIHGRREEEKERAIEAGLERAAQMAARDELGDAIRELDGLLALQPSGPRVQQRRQELADRLRQRQRARTLSELRERATKEASAGPFDATLAEIAAALREYPDDVDFITLRTTVERNRRAFDVAHAEAEAVRQAAELESRGAFDQALAALAEAARLFPEAASLPALRTEIEQRREVALRKKKADEAEHEARRLAASGDPLAAWNKAQAALAEFPEHAGLAALEPEARAAAVAFETTQTAHAVQAAIAERRWERAESAIREFQLKHGEKSALPFRNDLQSARRARQGVLDKAGADARAKISQADFVGAIGLIESLGLEGAELKPFEDLLSQARKGLEGQAFERSFQELRDLVSMALDDGEIDLALTTIAEGRKKFEKYPPFVEIDARVRREQLLAAALDQASRHLSARQWADAIRVLESASAGLGSDRRISDLLARVRREQQDYQAAVDAALAEARALLKAGDYDQAVASVTQAIGRLPDVPALQQTLAEATAQLQARERAAKVKAAAAGARALLSGGQLEQADALLRKALQDLPREKVIEDLLAEVQSAQRRRAAIQRYVDKVGDHLKLSEADRAERVLQDALKEFPGVAALLDLRIPIALGAARRHLNAGRFTKARREADEAVQQYGDDPRLAALVRDIEEAISRRAELDRMLAEAAALLDEGESEAALQKLDRVPDWARGNEEVVELRTRGQRLIAWRTAEFQRVSSNAEQLLHEGRCDEAVSAIEAASREKQLRKLLQPQLEHAIATRDAARQAAQELAREVGRIGAVFNSDGPRAALQMIDALGPDAMRHPEVRALRERCERRIEDLERPVAATRFEARTPIPEPAGPAAGSRKWLFVGVGAAVALIAVIMVIRFNSSSPQPIKKTDDGSGQVTVTPPPPREEPKTESPGKGEISVSPLSLNVDYQIGKAFPGARAINVSSAGSPVSFTASVEEGQGWLSVSPDSGTTPGSLTVSVRVVGLGVGTHRGSIHCAAASGKSFTIPVELTIRPGF